MADEQQQQQPPADSSQGESPKPGVTPGDNEQKQAPTDFTSWFNTLAPEVQELVDTHVDGLKNALKSERQSKKDLERQLKDLTKQAEDGSELHTKLQALQTELQTTSAKANFFEQVATAKVTNPKLAWLAAVDAGLVDMRTGECDLGKLKQQAPELFQAKAGPPQGNQGSGAGQAGVKLTDMNQLIRDSVFGVRGR